MNDEHKKFTDSLKKSKNEYEKLSKEAEIAQKTYDTAKVAALANPKDLPKVIRSPLCTSPSSSIRSLALVIGC